MTIDTGKEDPAGVGQPCVRARATIAAVKGIGTFMAIFLVGIGVATYLVTRPPNHALDAPGRAWVERYEKWTDTTERQLDRAVVGMDFSSRTKNARLIEPLRRCSVSFAQIGDPPALLTPVHESVIDACSRAERAARVNDRFDEDSLATINLNLRQAEQALLLSRRKLALQLGEAD